jgi:hypothetical protein
MSKLIFILSLAFVTLTSFDASAINIDITLTSVDGCRFRIQGELDLTWTGGFESFTGTVTASGGEGCLNGTWEFGMVIDDNNGPGSNPDIGGTKAYRFNGNAPLIDILKNEPQTLHKMITKMESN